MTHETSRTFRGEPAAALDTVGQVLMANGFVQRERDARRVVFTGRGAASTKENPLRGATRIGVTVRGGELRLAAELGGTRRLMLFVSVFPAALFVVLAVVLGLTGPSDPGTLLVRFAPAIAVWLVLGPALGLWARRRTTAALDDLLANAAANVRTGA